VAPNAAEPSGVIRSTTCTGGVKGAIGGCGANSGFIGGGRERVGRVYVVFGMFITWRVQDGVSPAVEMTSEAI
jgi:hypothetical protein